MNIIYRRSVIKSNKRNVLILEYLRFVKELKPLTIMMENVPGLINYHLFKDVINEFKYLGYKVKIDIKNVKDYGVPQKRKRMIMIGSLLGDIELPKGTGEKLTVRDVIGNLESIETTKDPLHKIKAKHKKHIL
ncbi:MAG: DNA cytosine methyltransferase, partial [Bacteroidales bacterium]